MITRLRTGFYKLIETKNNIKILSLDNEIFAWIETIGFGEMLIITRREHKTDCKLSEGRFYLYDVKDVEGITDLMHLELEAGPNCWQGYLLPNGIPAGTKKKLKAIPTHELITTNPELKDFILKRKLIKQST